MAVPNSMSLPPVSPVSPVSPLNDEQRKAAAALLRRVSSAADELGRLFAGHGHELALVGGPVRDVFLGRTPGDLDLTTDAPPEEVLRIVRDWADKVWTVGIDFGTVGLRKNGTIFEITTYRSEEYAPRSRKPGVHYGTSLEEDLRRRDFTINAMAARLPGHELVDPFGGLTALREKMLRTPGSPDESFSDDPLRILRAARFAAQLGFTVADDVQEAISRQAAGGHRLRRTDHRRADQADADPGGVSISLVSSSVIRSAETMSSRLGLQAHGLLHVLGDGEAECAAKRAARRMRSDLGERLLRRSGRPQHLLAQRGQPAERVDQLMPGQARRHGVDGEVPAAQVLFQRRPVVHARLAGPGRVLLAAVGGDLEDGAVLPQPDRAEVDAHGPYLVRPVPDDPQDLFPRRVGGQVKVPGRPAQEHIPDRPADQRELVAVPGEEPPQLVSGRRHPPEQGRSGLSLLIVQRTHRTHRAHRGQGHGIGHGHRG